MHKHPDPQVQRLIDTAGDGSKKMCSAGSRGYYILISGDYAPCAPMFRKFGKMGNILQDDAFRSLSGRELLCPEFPPEHPDVYPSPVPELTCWCKHHTIEFVPPEETSEAVDQRMARVTETTPAYVFWEMSRLCNFSCHYCLAPEKIFNSRTSKTYVSGGGEEISPRTFSELKDIADKIFRRFDRVTLVLGGPMEPLTNPHIVELMRHLLRYADRIDTLTITTNGSLTKKLDAILAMGWRSKLILYCSLHILDDNFDPFAVVRMIQNAWRSGATVEVHCIPSSEVMKFLPDYMRFFAFFGIKVNVHPLVVDFGGTSVMKYSYPPDFEPKAYASLRNFLARVWGAEVPAAERSFFAAAESLNSVDAPVCELRAPPLGGVGEA